MSRWSQMFASSVYFDIVKLWSLESQPAGLSLASYSSVISHWKQTLYITNSVKCMWALHWVILTDRCCAQRFQKYVKGYHGNITSHTPAPGFFSCFLDLIVSPTDSFIFFWQSVFKVSCNVSAETLQRLRDMAGIMSPATIPGVILPVSQKCDGTGCVQLLVSRNPFAGGFPWSPLAVLSTLCPQAAPGSGWSLGLCTWSRLNQTPCFFQAISLIVEIILNSVLACRILAIPCSFSLHQ